MRYIGARGRGGGEGGGVNNVPKKFSQVAEIFVQNSRKVKRIVRCNNLHIK